MKKVIRYLDDILLITGVALISIGVFQIYVPIGYIALGACCVAGAYFYAKRR